MGNVDEDGVPFLTLSYANGPGYDDTYSLPGIRRDYREMETESTEFRFSATVPLDSETHGGDDVGVYASGPMSHLFVGNYEQNNIPLMAAYAAGIGPYNDNIEECSGASMISLVFSSYVLVILVIVQKLFI